jgi:hypothetical protein
MSFSSRNIVKYTKNIITLADTTKGSYQGALLLETYVSLDLKLAALLIEYFTGMSGIFSSAFNRTAVEKVL